MLICSRLFLAIVSIGMGVSCLADDGYIEFGGSPRLLSSHESIQMVKEVVSVNANASKVYVTADFWFKNHGGATAVRMGFPDQGSKDDHNNKIRPKTTLPNEFSRLQSFQSWVNGKLVKTMLVGSGDSGNMWHAKMIHFGKGELIHVKCKYWTPTGISFLGQVNGRGLNRWESNASYVMSTGASWKGEIGYAKVVVRVDDPALLMPFQIDSTDRYYKNVLTKPQRVVRASGFTKPTVTGRIFTFERRSFEPKESDNIFVGWMSDKQTPP